MHPENRTLRYYELRARSRRIPLDRGTVASPAERLPHPISLRNRGFPLPGERALCVNRTIRSLLGDRTAGQQAFANMTKLLKTVVAEA